MTSLRGAMNILKEQGVSGLAGETGRYLESESDLLYQSIVLPLAVKEVSREFASRSAGLTKPEELVDFATDFSCLGISAKPVQNRKEIVEFCELLGERKVQSMLEIGTDKGGTLFLFARMAQPNAKILSVNLPYSSLNAWCMKYRTMLYSSFATRGQRMHLLTANSHEEGTLKRVKGRIDGDMLDLLFIDGDHSYEGVKRDFEMYSPLVRKGGIIAFHDISGFHNGSNESVGRFWREVREGRRHIEIEHTKGPGLGIGVIYHGEKG